LDLNDKTYYIYNPLDPDNPTPVPAFTNPFHTNHNILITGNGQDPKRLFGQSKCKLVFIGNGFFVNVPVNSNNYIPDPSRKPIEIELFNPDNSEYWEFDVLEEGNTYNGDVTYPLAPGGNDAPVFGALNGLYWGVDSRVMPQVSEFTRVKAFGSFTGDIKDEQKGITLFDTWGYSYNILSIIPQDIEGAGPGARAYDIKFANELKRMPVITATYVFQPQDIIAPFVLCALYITNKSTMGFTLVAVPISGDLDLRNFLFDFHVF